MAVKMNLWSMTLLPGEKYPLYVRRDFQITNAALGEELRDESGRSVVKVTHNPIHPSAFDDSDDEIDSDFDSDMEDDEFDVDGEDDEEEDDDEEEEEGAAEAAKKVKAVAKEALKTAEADGDASMEGDEDEDDEDEDDEDMDSEDEEVETSVLCSLTAGKIEQASLNLTFVEGEVVMFEVSGENSVHLMGNYIDQFPDVDSESEFDSDEDDYPSDLYDSEEDDEEDGPVIEELDEEVTIKPKKAIKAAKEEKAVPAAAAPVAEKPVSQKRKAEDIESPAKATAAATPAAEGLSKAQKKKLAKKAKLEEAAPAAPAAAAEKPKAAAAKAAPSKRTTPSGLIIEDITVGTGPVAKGGKRLGMRYIGKLTTGKQFDANTAGKPFSFVLGRGEVIKGWDEGLMGMAVGGERRLTIPPALAYGRKALPGIPANSTLKFDVKLVSIN